MKTLTKYLCITGTITFTGFAWAQAPAQAALQAPSGYWRIVDDNVVLEFTACANDKEAVCAVVRGVPPLNPKEDPPPKCGEVLGQDFKLDKNKQRWEGKVFESGGANPTKARLQSGKKGGLDLTFIALGGLYTETVSMIQVKDHTPCTTTN
jgi:hypothetical protein